MYGYRLDGSTVQTQLHLNVYDLNPQMNQSCFKIGLGFYHSGLEIGSTQYTFAGHDGSHTGVMEVTPKTNHPNFRESILLGKTSLSPKEINKIIDSLRDKFPGDSYDVIRKNCNTFTNCVCEAILHKKIPGYVNRLANLGKFFTQISDFFVMRPYNQKYEVSAKALGVQSKASKSPFEQGSGVMIG